MMGPLHNAAFVEVPSLERQEVLDGGEQLLIEPPVAKCKQLYFVVEQVM